MNRNEAARHFVNVALGVSTNEGAKTVVTGSASHELVSEDCDTEHGRYFTTHQPYDSELEVESYYDLDDLAHGLMEGHVGYIVDLDLYDPNAPNAALMTAQIEAKVAINGPTGIKFDSGKSVKFSERFEMKMARGTRQIS